ncbi:MAG: hypothetical protein MI724_12000 [Spirochaetales bacterium]|nr:hypothetical protein [Spirochaetales bacterium]
MIDTVACSPWLEPGGDARENLRERMRQEQQAAREGLAAVRRAVQAAKDLAARQARNTEQRDKDYESRQEMRAGQHERRRDSGTEEEVHKEEPTTVDTGGRGMGPVSTDTEWFRVGRDVQGANFVPEMTAASETSPSIPPADRPVDWERVLTGAGQAAFGALGAVSSAVAMVGAIGTSAVTGDDTVAPATALAAYTGLIGSAAMVAQGINNIAGGLMLGDDDKQTPFFEPSVTDMYTESVNNLYGEQ